MKKISVPVLNDEYSINVFIGTPQELVKHGTKYLEFDEETVKRKVDNCKGTAWNAFTMDCSNYNPLILLNGDLPSEQAISTLAHEASHASDFIMEYIGLADESGEFRAHTISAVVRFFFKQMRLKVSKKR